MPSGRWKIALAIPSSKCASSTASAACKLSKRRSWDEIVLHRRALIRVSGNTLLNSGHLAELQRNGVIVCLVASLDSILRRIHLTLGARYHDPVERSRAIGELQREWRIRDIDQVVEFDATYVTEAILIERIVTFWRELAIRRG